MIHKKIPALWFGGSFWILFALFLIGNVEIYAQGTDSLISTQDIGQVSDSVLDTPVVLETGNQNLLVSLKSIARQAGLSLSYSKELIPGDKEVVIEQQNMTAGQALWHVLRNTSFRFGISVSGQLVLVRRKESETAKEFVNGTITGTVVDAETGDPMPGASVFLKGTNKGVASNINGEYELTGVVPGAYTLVATFIGYKRQEQEIEVTENDTLRIDFVMKPAAGQLDKLTVVSTGYQQLPKERVTGSFAHISNEVIERQVSTNIIDRLKGNVSGLVFSNHRGQREPFNIRGRNTIFAEADPLIVVDGFAYDGNVENINPNDVANITVLKDAAAASIWGAQAGNGVIVIETKKGSFNQPMQVSFSSSMTIGEKPDLYAQPRISSSDFIDFERWLFDQGFYNSDENSSRKPALTPAVEIMIQQRDGLITDAEAEARLDLLRTYDVRDDFNKYFYRNGVKQQHSISMGGGSDNLSYYLSAGLDNNLSSKVGNKYQRITLNSSNTFLPVENLELTANVNYVQSFTQDNNPGYGGIRAGSNSLYPYARLADKNGNPLPIVGFYRQKWVNSPVNDHLLDWQYRPLEELKLANNTIKRFDTRIQVGAQYSFFPWLSGEVKYQYQKATMNIREYKSVKTYEMRNMINEFTQVNPDGSLTYPVPLGGSLFTRHEFLTSNTLRGQFNFNRNWGDQHQLAAIAGAEVRDATTDGRADILYGYEDEYGTEISVDYITRFPTYPGGSDRIRNQSRVTQNIDRYVSYFANAAYTYKDRYTATLSARKDASNLFGVDTNQKGVPLWSAGLSWEISQEDFYNILWLPYLKLRATYGYNGNTYRDITALLTAGYSTSFLTGARTAVILNPPYPDLRWEKIKIINIGLDFSAVNGRISGSIEYYRKRGLDLIGEILLPPSANIGLSGIKRNVSETLGKGIDLVLRTINIRTGSFQWNSKVLFTYVTDIVTDYDFEAPTGRYIEYGSGGSGGFIYPLEGKPVFSLYSYRWAGLDRETGAPQGYLNGKISTDYASIMNNTSIEEMVYHGSAAPPYYGAMRNTISWKGFSLSANITWKFGYYFRRRSVYYSSMGNWGAQHGDYARRWQKPGDEKITNIPSRPEELPFNWRRDDFYAESEATVEKGDHIRLQDVRIAYEFTQSQFDFLPVNMLQVYAYGRNLGLLWKANDKGIDPDGQQIPPASSFSVGIKAHF